MIFHKTYMHIFGFIAACYIISLFICLKLGG